MCPAREALEGLAWLPRMDSVLRAGPAADLEAWLIVELRSLWEWVELQ